MKFPHPFRGKPEKDAAHRLYASLVVQARQPGFYLDCGVPDTVNGRFDTISIHAFLVLRRLKGDHGQTADLAQELFDIMFSDMDQNIREMGVGDLGVGKRIKAMVRAFYGRIAAYEAGLEGNDEVLAAALRRNLYCTVSPEDSALEAMGGYLRREAAALDAMDLQRLIAGEVSFGPPPAAGGETRKETR